VVRNPDQCKPGCPACSRVCPQSAIMFPRYEKDAAIAGAPGHRVTLDAAARRMFCTCTRQACPRCGTTAGASEPAAALNCDNLCPECGPPRPAETSPSGAAFPAADLPFDDLDALVERFDQQMQRNQSRPRCFSDSCSGNRCPKWLPVVGSPQPRFRQSAGKHDQCGGNQPRLRAGLLILHDLARANG